MRVRVPGLRHIIAWYLHQHLLRIFPEYACQIPRYSLRAKPWHPSVAFLYTGANQSAAAGIASQLFPPVPSAAELQGSLGKVLEHVQLGNQSVRGRGRGRERGILGGTRLGPRARGGCCGSKRALLRPLLFAKPRGEPRLTNAPTQVGHLLRVETVTSTVAPIPPTQCSYVPSLPLHLAQGALYASAVSLAGLTLGTFQRRNSFRSYLLEPAFVRTGWVGGLSFPPQPTGIPLLSSVLMPASCLL